MKTCIIVVKLDTRAPDSLKLETHVFTEEEFDAFVEESAIGDERIKIISGSGTILQDFENVMNERAGETWKIVRANVNLTI